MPKSQAEAFAEIEKTQAALARTIEDSKRLLNRSQQLIDCHKQQKVSRETEDAV